jgi:hypothetical protein
MINSEMLHKMKDCVIQKDNILKVKTKMFYSDMRNRKYQLKTNIKL